MNPIQSILLFLLFPGPVNSSTAQKTNHAVIMIHIEGSEEGDSIKAIQSTFNLRTPETRLETWLTIHHKEITIHFNSMQHPAYFSLYDRKRKNLTPSPYLVEPGDSVHFFLDGGKISYSGRGYLKMQCSHQIERSKEKYTKSLPMVATLSNKNLIYDYCDATLTTALNLLSTYHNKISSRAFQLMQADLLGFDLNFRIETSGFELYANSNSAVRLVYDSLYKRLNRYIKKIGKLPNDKMAAYSFFWPTALLKNYFVDSFYMRSKPFDLTTQYQYIQHHYHGTLRDHLITSLLHNFHRASDSLVTCLKTALAIVQDNELSGILHKQYLHYLQGTKAYNFSLRDTGGRLVKLSDFSNKTVVMDFWYTGCINCIDASTALQSIEHLFKNNDSLVFLSICVDRDKITWMQSLKGGKYSSPGRINLYTDQRGMEDPLIKYYDIFGYPTLLMVDKKGNLLSARLPDPRKNNGELLIKFIREALVP